MTGPSTPLDLEAIRPWLAICGGCDLGIGDCTHPDGDYRPAMANLFAEVERLRNRVHEAVDECQRRYATMQSAHDQMLAARREAVRRHGDEMDAAGKPRWSEISYYGESAAAAILAERDEARAEVERLRAELECGRAVVDLAIAWRNVRYTERAGAYAAELVMAVDAYRAGLVGEVPGV